MAQRRAHVLKRNKRVELPSRCIFLDTEAWVRDIDKETREHTFRLGVAKYVRLNKGRIKDEKEIISIRKDDIWDFIFYYARDKTRLWIFAHNMGYDFFLLDGFGYLEKNGWKIVYMSLESARFIIKARKGQKTLLFVDTYNYVRLPLEEIGKSIGMEKGKIDFEKASDDELAQYCARDVDILKRFVISLIRFWYKHKLGNFQPTISSLAFSAFRHRFMKHRIYIHNHEDALQLEQEALMGGRVEAFVKGVIKGKDVYILDVNSLYPAVMRAFEYPVKLIKYGEGISPEVLRRLLRTNLVIAEVYLETPEPAFPKKDGRLIFPIGRFTTVLTSPELAYALQKGYVKKVRRYAVYQGRKIFEDYVDFFYELRKKYKREYNRAWDLVCKLLLNSLWGKFAQRVRETEIVGEADPSIQGMIKCKSVETGERTTLYAANGLLIESKKEELTSEAFPAIAAHVTAYGRMLMYLLMRRAGFDKIYYVDTDALFVTEEGKKNLEKWINDDELGKLKIKEIVTELAIFGPKKYLKGDELVMAGLPLNRRYMHNSKAVVYKWLRARSLLGMGIRDRVLQKKETWVLKLTREKLGRQRLPIPVLNETPPWA
jgi:hypothetical protein